MLIEYNQSALLKNAISMIRDKNTPPDQFRNYLEKIGHYLAIEASKSFEIEEYKIDTPLEIANGIRIKYEIVLVGILRAALPMINGVLSEFTDATLGVVSASRGKMIDKDGKSFKINADYVKLPEIDDRIIIIVDPMLATGSTIKYLLELIKEREPYRIIVFCAIASKYGINQIESNFNNVDIYAGVVDEVLNDKGYIVPGLGDAGDRAFNTDHL